MLESQLPSFNLPSTKSPKKPTPPSSGAETPPGDLAQEGQPADTSPPVQPVSAGPIADGFATLDPNSVPPPERGKGSRTDPGGTAAPSTAPPKESHETLVPPDEPAPREAPFRGEATPGLPAPAHAETWARPGGKSSGVHNAHLPHVPGYSILGELGKGGMGVVYKAMQAGLNRLVALKMIRKDRATEEAVARFQDEAVAVARLRHPNIVQIFDIGEFEGQPYFSLEYIEGGSLDRFIQGNPQLPRASAQLVQMLARAMQVAHEQNIVHRDLKPGNVLVQAAPGAQDDKGLINLAKMIPKITDFGLAKQLDSADLGQTHSGAVLGTPYYMAPEQAEGWLREIKPWTDVYALGAILYELLTGRPPFKGATLVETLDQVRHLDPVPPRTLQPSVPRDLETICLKCLRKQPLGRYKTGGELADDLQRFLEDRPILGRPISWRERALKWARRSPMAAAAAGISVLLVLSLIGTLFVLMQVARHEVAEQQRVERSRSQFEARMSEANAKAQQALREKDPKLWEEALASVEIAYSILDSEEMLSDPSLRERADRLHRQAYAEVVGAQERARRRKQAEVDRAALRDCHDTAVVHSVLYTGLTGEQNYQAVEDQVARALAIFGVNPGEPVPPKLDDDFFTPAEQRQVQDWYYALLLFQAEATFRRARDVKLDDDDRRIRVRQAIEQLNRADRFRAPAKGGAEPGRTHASLRRRAAYLGLIQDTAELQRVEEQLARTPTATPLDHFLEALHLFERRADTEHAAQEVRAAVMTQSGRALELDPDYFGARYLVTVCQLQEGNLQVARDQLTACLKEQPKFIWLQLLRGFVWMQLGNLTEAENDFNAARNHPNPKIRYVALVNSSALSTRLQVWDVARLALAEAIAVMEAGDKANVPFPYPNYLILLDPNLSSMTSLAAATHLRQGEGGSTTAYINLAMVNKKRAETPWTAYLMLLDPSLASVTALAARQSAPVRDEVRRQALGDAVAALDSALANNPSTPGLLYSERGRLYMELEDFGRARADLAESICLSEEYTEGPERPLTERVKKDRLSLAELLFRNGNWRDTIDECQDLLGRAPDQLAAYRLKARAELALDHLAPARRTLEAYLQEAIRQGIRQVPRDELAEAYLTQGVLFAKSRDYRGAADSYTQGMHLYGRAERGDPRLDPVARKHLGQLYALRGWAYLGDEVASLAGKDFDEASRLDPTNVDARVGKADSLLRQDRLVEALVAAEEARQLGRQSSRVVFSAARTYAQAYAQGLRGKRPADVRDADVARWGDRAVELLAEALDLEPRDRTAAFWKQYVEGDSAFQPLRNRPAMTRLEQRATGTPR